LIQTSKPARADTITVVQDLYDPAISAALEATLVKVKGKAADVQIGTTVVVGGYAFVTGDEEFAAVLKSRGIDVRIAPATFDEDST
jgi:hypothetical protein